MDDTFDVLLGEEKKRFTLHNDFFIPRFEFFRAARSAAWNKDNPQRPTNLEDEDPDVFASYMRCVYASNADFFPEVELASFAPFIRLYLLADKLGDLMTANMVIDRMVRYSDEDKVLPGHRDVELAYNFTASGNPLRAVLRDYLIHEDSQVFDINKSANLPRDYLHDIIAGYTEIKRRVSTRTTTVKSAFCVKVSTMARCHYHQHGPSHPMCTPSQPAPVKAVQID